MRLRGVIVDNSPSVLRAAGTLLEGQGMAIVGVAVGSEEAVRIVEAQQPDVVLVDIDLGTESGLDLVRRLEPLLEPLGASSVLISTHAEEDYASLISASPAIGFLPKSELSVAAITQLLAGR
jgi:DNA-binding NarL/FixJ family response regulator